MATIPDPIAPTEPQPAWDVALLFPSQGDWSEGEYLGLDTNRLVELIDGNLEVLPMPTFLHQLIVEYLFDSLKELVKAHQLGKVIFAPLPMRIRAKTFREPDIILFSKDAGAKPTDKYLKSAQLVIEVVSADDKSHKRDYQEKRGDYLNSAFRSIGLLILKNRRITVLALDGGEYRPHGEFTHGQQATSLLLDGFTVEVSAVFAAGQKLS